MVITPDDACRMTEDVFELAKDLEQGSARYSY
jgi:hypothetical protein